MLNECEFNLHDFFMKLTRLFLKPCNIFSASLSSVIAENTDSEK